VPGDFLAELVYTLLAAFLVNLVLTLGLLWRTLRSSRMWTAISLVLTFAQLFATLIAIVDFVQEGALALAGFIALLALWPLGLFWRALRRMPSAQ
jgi:hypothetical protein